MQQGGRQEIRILVASAKQPVDDVQGVSAVGHWHRIKEGPRLNRQEPMRPRDLVGAHAGAQMSEKLLDPMHRRAGA